MTDLWVVRVNEGIIEATRQGSDWWQARRPVFVASGKLRDVVPAYVIGGTVDLGPYGAEDAEFMAEHMIAAGVPASAVKVRKA